MEDKVLKLLEQMNLLDFCNKLSSCSDFMIFGGFVRDTLLEIKPNDLDIVVENQSQLESFIKNNNFKQVDKNAFGGYRLLLNNNIQVDIWSLEKSNFKTSTFRECFKYVFFSCNAIGYLFKENKIVHSNEYFNLHKKEIKINNKKPYLKKNHLWKNYMMKKVNKLKGHYNIDSEVLDFLKVEKKEFQFIIYKEENGIISKVSTHENANHFLKTHRGNRDRDFKEKSLPNIDGQIIRRTNPINGVIFYLSRIEK